MQKMSDLDHVRRVRDRFYTLYITEYLKINFAPFPFKGTTVFFNRISVI
jgi:hypothetical protein